MSTSSRALGFLREHGVAIALQVLVNVILPFVVYDVLQHRFGDVRALLASSVPPILWSIGEFVRSRRVDAVSLLVIVGIVLSLLAFIGGGSPKFLQLRENFVTVAIALVFLGSAAIGKPLIYQLARGNIKRQAKSGGADLAQFEALRDNVYFKRTMMFMTLVWGFGLLASAGVACALVFALPIGTYLLVSPIVGYGSMGALGLWTFYYSRLQQRKGRERRAAAERESSTSLPSDT